MMDPTELATLMAETGLRLTKGKDDWSVTAGQGGDVLVFGTRTNCITYMSGWYDHMRSEEQLGGNDRSRPGKGGALSPDAS